VESPVQDEVSNH